MGELVKVVIPVYKTDLSVTEIISLKRCLTVLNKYIIVIIKPKSLDVNALLAKYVQRIEVESFEDSFFANIDGYNRLMLSTEFYERFQSSRYILIYQLDAYVFRDELTEWCNKDYDYIGAPWLCKRKYSRWFMRLFLGIRGEIYKVIHVKHRQQCFYKVGNGGFSLRRVASCYNRIIQMQNLVNHYLKNVKTSSQYNEDVFWALEATKDKKFIVAGWKEALSFSFDLFPERSYQLAGNKLPFGCHRWHKEREFWDKFILTQENSK